MLLAANDTEEKVLRELSTKLVPFGDNVAVVRFTSAADVRKKVQKHLERGDRIFAGVVLTSVIDALYDLFERYRDAILISTGSTAPKYMTPDNIYRLLPPDGKSSKMMSDVLREARVAPPRVILYDKDSTWASQLSKLLQNHFHVRRLSLGDADVADAAAAATAAVGKSSVVLLSERWAEEIPRLASHNVLHRDDDIVLGDVAFMADIPVKDRAVLRKYHSRLFAMGAFGGFTTDVSAVARILGTHNISPMWSLLVSAVWIAFDCAHMSSVERSRYLQSAYGPRGSGLMDEHGDVDFVQVGVVHSQAPSFASWSVYAVNGKHPIYGNFRTRLGPLV